MNKALKIPLSNKRATEIHTHSLDLETLDALEKIGAGDKLFMQRLFQNYLIDSSAHLVNIETAIKQKRFDELHDYCHAIKGNSLSVGAMQMAKTIDAFSALNPTTPAFRISEMLNSLNKEFSDLMVTIEAYLKTYAATSRNNVVK